MRPRTLLAPLALCLLLSLPRPARADDGTDGGDTPLACDGGLCATTTGAGCAVVPPGRRGAGAGAVIALCLAPVLWSRVRRAPVIAAAVPVSAAVPEPEAVLAPPPLEKGYAEAGPVLRRGSLSYAPLPLLVGRVGLELVLVPRQHHGLVVSPFYASSTTAAVTIFDDQGNGTQLPEQRFYGGGAELGYRYYFGASGPRGIFVGPSVILAGMQAVAQNGDTLGYLLYGGAVDGGYQLLLADRIALTLAGGLQVTGTSQPLPAQQYPAHVYANFAVLPRILASVGVAF